MARWYEVSATPPWCLLAIGFASATACAPTFSSMKTPVPGASAGVTAFVDVGVIPMDVERALVGQTVLVEGGWITGIGPSHQVRVPVGAVRIEGRGKFLIPGLGDCHTHVTAMPTGGDPGIPADSVAERRLFLWLAGGVTTIRNLDYMDKDGRYWLLNGSDVLRLRARTVAGQMWSPRIYTSGQWAPKQYSSSGRREAEWPQPRLDSVAAYVTAYKAAGYDFLKVHDESPEVFEALLVAARRVGMPVVGHVIGESTSGSLGRALAGEMQSIEHLSGYPYLRSFRPDTTAYTTAIGPAVAATQRAGTWNCATAQLVSGTSRPGLIRSLYDAGARLLLGTDSPLGGTIHGDLEAFVAIGLSPYEALATGTKHFAVYLKTIDESGTIAVGKRADLVLLDSNPLANIRNTRQIAGVMLGGRWLSREAIDRRVAFIKATGGSGPMGGLFGPR